MTTADDVTVEDIAYHLSNTEEISYYDAENAITFSVPGISQGRLYMTVTDSDDNTKFFYFTISEQ